MPDVDGVCRRLIRLSVGSSGDVGHEGGGPPSTGAWTSWESELPAVLRECLARLPMDSAVFWDTAKQACVGATSWAVVLSQFRAIEEVVVDGSGAPMLRLQRPRVPSSFAAVRDRGNAAAEGVYLRFGNPDCLLLSASTSAVMHVPTQHLQVVAVAIQDVASTDPVVSIVRDLLRDNGFFPNGAGTTASGWSFPDRLFHAVATYGHGYEGGYGATWAGLRAESAAASAPSSVRGDVGVRIGLPLDDSPLLGADLGTVLAARRSCRSYAERDLSPADLAPLLQRSLRTQRMWMSKEGLSVALHPYPSGGACDEITTLVALRGTAAAPHTPVLATYSNHTNDLNVVPESSELAMLILRRFGAAGEVKGLPAAALVFVADYGRVALKYEAIAYATILRNVGAIYQTIYLVAQAIGLGACAVGGGWGDVERAIQGAGWPSRVVVGGMLVGWPRGGG